MEAVATVAPRTRASYIAISCFVRRSLVQNVRHSSSSRFRRADFMNQPFSGSYEPGQPTYGPLDDASVLGVPQTTPRALKEHLDQFVIGQDRAKRIISTQVFNHYQRIREARRQEDEQQQLLKQRLRAQKRDAHSFDDEGAGIHQAIHTPTRTISSTPPADPPPLLEKSNILLLGPSGVGKTLIVKTLARLLSIPFSMSDCTPFTQAGYIGEDADVCVERLLAAANYDVEAAEHGIICLDEIDKLSAAKPAHGRDVSGEGVQQALLKIIEGTTLHIPVKAEKSTASKASSLAKDPSATGGGPFPGGSTSPPSGSSSASAGPSKGDTYSVRTDNILFICTGAFNGLHKTILNRVARGSIGFGTPLRTSALPTSSTQASSSSSGTAATLPSDILITAHPGSAEAELIAQHLPFFNPHFFSAHAPTPGAPAPPPPVFNLLDLVAPADLQGYGLIPELVGRLPVTAALAPLDEAALVRVLREPRNALTRQYARQFQTLGVELRFTRGALRAIARQCRDMGTGARGLRTCVERLLEDASYTAPGSSIKYVLITEAVAERRAPPEYFIRGQQLRFQALMADEEEEWEARMGRDAGPEEGGGDGSGAAETGEKRRAAGLM